MLSLCIGCGLRLTVMLSKAQTPNSSAVSSSRKERANLDDVVRSLQNYGMYYNELDAWNVRCPEFKERVLGPFLSDRHSAMQPASHKRFNEALDRTRYSNEATFHNATLPILFSDEHTVATQKKDFAGSIKLVQLSYAESDGLSSQEKPNLATGFVPGKEPSIKAVGMTNPIPDTVWGKLHPSFIKPGSQGPKDINVIKSSGCHVDWPFFIAEAKSGRGSVADARNQAQRDGGSIIKSLLKLKEYVEGRGYRKKAGAVEDFWVFSLCWDPDYANILVHWVEIMADETEIFHSTKVRQKFLDDEEGQAQLRACGHNIFNHGLFTHVPAMEKLWAKAIKAEKPFDDDFDLYD